MYFDYKYVRLNSSFFEAFLEFVVKSGIFVLDKLSN